MQPVDACGRCISIINVKYEYAYILSLTYDNVCNKIVNSQTQKIWFLNLVRLVQIVGNGRISRPMRPLRVHMFLVPYLTTNPMRMQWEILDAHPDCLCHETCNCHDFFFTICSMKLACKKLHSSCSSVRRDFWAESVDLSVSKAKPVTCCDDLSEFFY